MSDSRRLLLCQQCYEQEITNDGPALAVDPRFGESGYVPSDTELAQLKGALPLEEEELVRYQAEIAVLRRKLEYLEAKERLLKTNVERCRSAISASRRVPTEIREAIFSFLCDSRGHYSLEVDDDNGDERASIIQTIPLTLSHVCTRRRAIVNACPRFWASICIQFTVPDDITNLLRLYLERSKTHPLSLYLTFSLEDDYELPESFSKDKLKTWKLLTPHFTRCKEMVLGVADMDDLPEVPNLRFPELKSFQFLPRSDWSDVLSGPFESHWFWDAIYDAGQLTDLVTEGLMPAAYIPYDQIASLTIENLVVESTEALLDLLGSELCLALTSLTFTSPEDPLMEIEPFDQAITLPFLRHLAIDEGFGVILPDNDFLSIFCPKLGLPALTSFSISCFGWASPVSALLQRSSSTLQKVSIRMIMDEDLGNPAERVFAMLQSLPNLTYLELTVTRRPQLPDLASVVIDIFEILILGLRVDPESNSGRTAFLPKLQSLRLKFSDVEMTTEFVKGVLDVVLSRHVSSTTCTLTCLRFKRRDPYPSKQVPLELDHDYLDRIRGLRDAGIDVIFEDLW